MTDKLSTVTRRPKKPARRGPLTARLRAVHPREVSFEVKLGAEPVVIGRSKPNVVLAHETVSRSHFEITFDAHTGRHVGKDAGSHNGSRIDGARVDRGALADQSVVQLGDVSLVYEIDEVGASTDDAETDACPGRSPAMQSLRGELMRAATDPVPVLLIGETGTGKEYLARELHARSGRSGPLLSINCAALASQLVEAQLFGHVKGAFTGATADSVGMFRAANGGTMLLDEIGELPLELQPKLLRALQEREVQPVGSSKIIGVDVRVIAATHCDLERAVEAGTFRRDLYARLSVCELHVPPLRERRGDLLAWIDRLHETWRAQRRQESKPLELDPEAAEALLLHPWLSNLREVERLVHALAPEAEAGEVIGVCDLPRWFAPRAAGSGPTNDTVADAKPDVPSREQFVELYEQLGGNVRALARHLDRDRRQIYRWMETYGLRRS